MIIMVRVVITGRGSKGFTFAVNDDRGKRTLDEGKATKIGNKKYKIKFKKLNIEYEDYLTKTNASRRIKEAYEFFKKHKR